jgi:hypothetical protein
VSDTPAESTPDEAPTNVIEAILAVMREVKAVGKDGYNEQQKFNFRGIDGVQNAVGPAARKYGLVCLPTRIKEIAHDQVEIGAKRSLMAHSKTVVVYTFFGPGGLDDKVEVEVPGESMDSGDKGTAKAMSVAYRTLWIQALNLPTHEKDPDEDVYERSPAAILPEEVHAILKQAQDEADPAAFLIGHGNRLGEDRLAQLTIEVPDPTRNGERVTMNGAAVFHQWIGYYQQLAEQQAAGREARAAQAAAEGPQVAPEPAPVAAGETAPVTAQGWPVERALRAEIALQAKILGQQDPNKYAGWVLSQLGVASFEQIAAAHVAVVAPWVVGQRERVIHALTAAGNAVGAATYRGIRANGPLPQDLFKKLWAGDIPDAAPAVQPAPA